MDATQPGFPIVKGCAWGDFWQLSTFVLDRTEILIEIGADGITTAQLEKWREWVTQRSVLNKLTDIFGENHPIFQALNPDKLFSAFLCKYPVNFLNHLASYYIQRIVQPTDPHIDSFQIHGYLDQLVADLTSAMERRLSEFRDYLEIPKQYHWCDGVYSLGLALHIPESNWWGTIQAHSGADTIIRDDGFTDAYTRAANTNWHFDEIIFKLQEFLTTNSDRISPAILNELRQQLAQAIDSKGTGRTYGTFANPHKITPYIANRHPFGELGIVVLTDGVYPEGTLYIDIDPHKLYRQLLIDHEEGKLRDDLLYAMLGKPKGYFPWG